MANRSQRRKGTSIVNLLHRRSTTETKLGESMDVNVLVFVSSFDVHEHLCPTSFLDSLKVCLERIVF
ncbi:hypothetical protein YC2023_066494 [Brassica napus]